jgi:hypothetical protein
LLQFCLHRCFHSEATRVEHEFYELAAIETIGAPLDTDVVDVSFPLRRVFLEG